MLRTLIKFKLWEKVIHEFQLPFCPWMSWDTQTFLYYISNLVYARKRKASVACHQDSSMKFWYNECRFLEIVHWCWPLKLAAPWYLPSPRTGKCLWHKWALGHQAKNSEDVSSGKVLAGKNSIWAAKDHFLGSLCLGVQANRWEGQDTKPWPLPKLY